MEFDYLLKKAKKVLTDYYSFIDINAEDLIDIDIDNSSIDKLKFIKLMIRYANLEKVVWNDLSMVDSDSLKFVVKQLNSLGFVFKFKEKIKGKNKLEFIKDIREENNIIVLKKINENNEKDIRFLSEINYLESKLGLPNDTLLNIYESSDLYINVSLEDLKTIGDILVYLKKNYEVIK